MAERFLEVVPVTCLAGLLYAVGRFLRLRSRGRPVRRTRGEELARLLFVCYVTGLLNLVLVPPNFWAYIWFYLRNGYEGLRLGPLFSGGFNFVPALVQCAGGKLVLGDWARGMLMWNVVSFVPLGFFLPFVWPQIDMRRALLTAVGAPLVIEALQPIVGRACDVDDLICNFIGIMLGFDLAQALQALLRRIRQ